MKQLTLDGVTYNLVPVEQPKPASPFYIAPVQMAWSDAMNEAEEKGMRLLRSEELHVLARDGHLSVKEGDAWTSTCDWHPWAAWLADLSDGYVSVLAKSFQNKVVCVPKDFDLAAYLTEKA